MESRDLLYIIFASGSVIALFYLVLFILKKWSGSKKRFFPHLVQSHLHTAGLLLCLSIILDIIISMSEPYMKDSVAEIMEHAFHIFTIIAIGFFVIKIIKVIYEIFIHYYSTDAQDYSVRRAKTRLLMLQRILNILIVFMTIIALLITFPQVRQFGNTLLASAGVAGIILGFAAQKSLGTLFSGIQIALAQPVKLDDIVVVDGQFGTIGEITLTYIVVNTWDEKRLIVPINYFLEHSFENWTRDSPEIVGVVKIYADYSLPVEEVRARFDTWLEESPLWDRRKSGLLITASTQTNIEVRATMSAKNSDDAYELECLIREKLITYIRENYAQALPYQRVQYKEVKNEQES